MHQASVLRMAILVENFVRDLSRFFWKYYVDNIQYFLNIRKKLRTENENIYSTVDFDTIDL